MFATNSMVYRRIENDEIPNFYYNAHVGDYPLTIYLSLIGKVYFMSETMSVYRFGVANSWSMRIASDVKKEESHIKNILTMLDELNTYTNYMHNSVIEEVKTKREFQILILQGRLKEAKEKKFQLYYSSFSTKSKLIVYLRKYLPSFYKILKNFKRVLL